MAWSVEGLSAEQMADRIEPLPRSHVQPFVAPEMPAKDPVTGRKGLEAMKGALKR